MYYRIERAYVTITADPSDHKVESPPTLVLADNANAAAAAFLLDERATLLGAISDLPGDKAVATGRGGEDVFVIFAQRAAEAIPAPQRPRRDGDPSKGRLRDNA